MVRFFFLWHEIIDAFSDSLIASAVCGLHQERSRMPQVMCLKESRKLLAYLEKEFGKAWGWGFSRFFWWFLWSTVS